MKFLYYASYLLSAPFFALSWVLYAGAWLLNWIGETIHDCTTFRVWHVLHQRACAKLANAPREGRAVARTLDADVGPEVTHAER